MNDADRERLLNDPAVAPEVKYMSRYCEQIDSYVEPTLFSTIYAFRMRHDSVKEFFKDTGKTQNVEDKKFKQKVKKLIRDMKSVTKNE